MDEDQFSRDDKLGALAVDLTQVPWPDDRNHCLLSCLEDNEKYNFFANHNQLPRTAGPAMRQLAGYRDILLLEPIKNLEKMV
ncbi:hypothetical protein Pcinc_038248 [Petrolisthes cinctipes]|uniref:Uncharacterized protein n=1 Tax=Petrolisthes cinctipes TaxID=88211 RepID=A0AAE1BSE2_PETCI|nr:hypothetical protein Pcinc_038248 [Petrolisthes cinctipes]